MMWIEKIRGRLPEGEAGGDGDDKVPVALE